MRRRRGQWGGGWRVGRGEATAAGGMAGRAAATAAALRCRPPAARIRGTCLPPYPLTTNSALVDHPRCPPPAAPHRNLRHMPSPSSQHPHFNPPTHPPTTNSTLVGTVFSLPEILLRQRAVVGTQRRRRGVGVEWVVHLPNDTHYPAVCLRGCSRRTPSPQHTQPHLISPRRLSGSATLPNCGSKSLDHPAHPPIPHRHAPTSPHLVQSAVRHRHDAHVGLDGAEGEVGCLRLGVFAQRVEHGRLRGKRGGARRMGGHYGVLGSSTTFYSSRTGAGRHAGAGWAPQTRKTWGRQRAAAAAGGVGTGGGNGCGLLRSVPAAAHHLALSSAPCRHCRG